MTAFHRFQMVYDRFNSAADDLQTELETLGMGSLVTGSLGVIRNVCNEVERSKRLASTDDEYGCCSGNAITEYEPLNG